MAVLKPRSRLIYVRISEDEFQKFTSLCQTEGARSMSDLMRVALQRMMMEQPNEADRQYAERLQAIRDMMFEVNEKLGKLTGMLSHYMHVRVSGDRVVSERGRRRQLEPDAG